MMLLQTKALKDLPNFNADAEVIIEAGGTTHEKHRRRHQASARKQTALLVQREIKNVVRDKQALISRFGMTLVLNLVFSFIFFQIGDASKSTYDLSSHYGGIFTLLLAGFASATQAPLLTFPLDRLTFSREVYKSYHLSL